MPAERTEIRPEEFEFMRGWVQQQSSIALAENKQYLVQIRLEGVARSLGLENIHKVVDALRFGNDRRVSEAVIEAMTTNETSFFRDPSFFENLKEVILPQLIAARRSTRKLSIWCAASSSGQEPYSILMMLRERFPEVASWDIDFLASDLSLEMLERTKEGLYSDFEVRRGLQPGQLERWFKKDGRMWRVREELRDLVRTERIHLGRPLPHMPHFDLVLLRNVLIYFDAAGKEQAIRSIRRVMPSDGWLVLGTSEVLPASGLPFQRGDGKPGWLLEAA